MDGLRSGPDASMTASMVAFVVMTAVTIVLVAFLRESPMMLAERDAESAEP